MDKSTLSNYGWVVCVILVLAIMISLATPFGTVIKNGVAKTVENFKGDAEDVIDNMGGASSFDDLVGSGAGGAGGGSGEGPTLLNGNGQVYNQAFVASPLSFRSSAPKSELQSVQVNGETVDPSNYTVTEGSTIVTFNNDYAQNLALGDHSIAIVSDSGSATGGFTVKNTVPANVTYTYTTGFSTCEECGKTFSSTPENCYCGKYTNQVSTLQTFVLEEGDALPTELYLGDIVIYGDYEYRYGQQSMVGFGGDWSGADMGITGWGARPIDTTKTTYGKILTSINGAPVESLAFAFYNCKNLTTAPVIPEGVTSLYYTFYGCTSLEGEVIVNAQNINTAHATGDYHYNCFYNTEKDIVITGSCSDTVKAALAGTATNGNVTY